MKSNKDKIILIQKTVEKDRNVLFSCKESYLVSLSLIVASSVPALAESRVANHHPTYSSTNQQMSKDRLFPTSMRCSQKHAPLSTSNFISFV